MKVSILGLGYVGLPLVGGALRGRFAERVVGFDINRELIRRINERILDLEELGVNESIYQDLGSGYFNATVNEADLRESDIYVVTVPTPIDSFNVPDLAPIKEASKTIGRAIAESTSYGLEKKAVVIYESTVYPGLVNEVCRPLLAEYSNNNANYVKLGYSPERINPGDRKHGLINTAKIISGDDQDVINTLTAFYGSFVEADLHVAESIEVAEAAKVLENTQRDINIALMNEVALICSRLDIDTNAVIDAAATKWNFMDFRPGLVGGHCVSVDPYYLSYKAESLGINPRIIKAGRSINDGMAGWIGRKLVKAMNKQRNGQESGGRCLILGITFKPNVKDIRNSKAIELAKILDEYGKQVDVYDPVLGRDWRHPGLNIVDKDTIRCKYDGIVVCVPHTKLTEEIGEILEATTHERSVVFDVARIVESFSGHLMRL